MNTNKKRILFCSEATYLSTGYATVFRKIIQDMYNTNKYDIAEHASYAKLEDSRIKSVPWKLYCNTPNKGTQEESIYNSSISNKFGVWRFNRILLDFKPDIVIGLRDPYMDYHIVNSYLKKYYFSILAPPVDSIPQKDEYLYSYSKSDAIFGQTDYAVNVFKDSIPNANIIGSIGCGVDTSIYYPRSKKIIRDKYGVGQELYIVGTVMRNQVRKLFPDLINSFKSYLSKCTTEQYNKSFLYLHTAYPEKSGWNLIKIIKESGIGHKIIFSYQCRLCHHVFPSIFQDAKTVCPKCKNLSAVTITSDVGYSNEQLAEIYNIFDLYIQVSSTEGFGIPVVEAAACGVKVASMDFGAMGEVIEKINGKKIKIVAAPRDMNNDSYRCVPDLNSIEEAINWGSIKESYIKQIENVKKYYDFNQTPKNLMEYIDSLNINNKWNNNYIAHEIKNIDINKLNNKEFLDYLFNDVLNQKQDRYSYYGKCIERDLFYGINYTDNSMRPINRIEILNQFIKLAEENEYLERCRLGLVEMTVPDYIKYANRNKNVQESE